MWSPSTTTLRLFEWLKASERGGGTKRLKASGWTMSETAAKCSRVRLDGTNGKSATWKPSTLRRAVLSHPTRIGNARHARRRLAGLVRRCRAEGAKFGEDLGFNSSLRNGHSWPAAEHYKPPFHAPRGVPLHVSLQTSKAAPVVALLTFHNISRVTACEAKSSKAVAPEQL
eukprot:scaffold61217_cov74-Phaeocystis_antarctica.AAC.2